MFANEAWPYEYLTFEEFTTLIKDACNVLIINFPFLTQSTNQVYVFLPSCHKIDGLRLNLIRVFKLSKDNHFYLLPFDHLYLPSHVPFLQMIGCEIEFLDPIFAWFKKMSVKRLTWITSASVKNGPARQFFCNNLDQKMLRNFLMDWASFRIWPLDRSSHMSDSMKTQAWISLKYKLKM